MSFDGFRDALPAALAWIRSDVLVSATLAQAGCAVVLLTLVLLVANPLRNTLSERGARLVTAPAQPLARAFARVSPWVLLLLLLWFAVLAFRTISLPAGLLRLVESLALAWVVIRLSSNLVRNARTALAIAIAAWIVATLNIAGLVAPILELLGDMPVPIGNFRLSVLLILKGIVTFAVLIWLANLSRFRTRSAKSRCGIPRPWQLIDAAPRAAVAWLIQPSPRAGHRSACDTSADGPGAAAQVRDAQCASRLTNADPARHDWEWLRGGEIVAGSPLVLAGATMQRGVAHSACGRSRVLVLGYWNYRLHAPLIGCFKL